MPENKTNQLKVLDLFSGILVGGFSLGLERAGMRTIAFCEIEEYPRRVLRKHWPDVPIFEDVRKLRREDLPEQPDVVVGGYPCQPFSLAGKRAGEDDNRHLWPEMLRLVEACRPRWVIAENVAGHISMGLDQVLFDLETAGYTFWPFVIPAVAVDAPHRRDRVWIVASNSNSNGKSACAVNAQMEKLCGTMVNTECSEWRQSESNGNVANWKNAKWEKATGWIGASGANGGEKPVANTNGMRFQGECRSRQERISECRETHADSDSERLEVWKRKDPAGARTISGAEPFGVQRWEPEPDVGRVANGISNRVDRLRALGNAVVPQIPEMIGRAIMAMEAA